MPSELTATLDLLLRTALQSLQAGNLEHAKQAYQKALKIAPNNPDANHYLGIIAYQAGNHSLAEKLIKKSLQVSPEQFQVLNNLGVIQKELGKLQEAKATYLEIIRLKPDYANAYANLGAIYKELGKNNEALNSLSRAMELDPKNVNTYNTMGVILRSLHRYAEAINCFRDALLIEPDHTETNNSIGNLLYIVGNYPLAAEHFTKALSTNKNYAEAYSNLGRALQKSGLLEQAEYNFKKALSLRPDEAIFIGNIGVNLCAKRQYLEAAEYYQKALKINPQYSDAYSSLLLLMNFTALFSKEEIFQQHARWQDHVIDSLPANRPQPLKGTQVTNRRIRVGYVSADFRIHSVAYFFEPLLTNQDPEKFEIFCYYNHTIEDDVTLSIKAKAEHWRSIKNMDDLEVVNLIRDDNIDILVDLAGYTAGSRLKVFVYKPAPIQITWLGYPNTTGLTDMDYRLTDDIADPVGESDRYHTETLIRLPHGFLCFKGDPTQSFECTPPYKHNGYITFGTFNNLSKITDEVIEVWAKVLLAVENSRILLKCIQFADDKTKKQILSTFNKFGIEDQRVELLGRVENTAEHQALYSKVDIALDPFPYNGTTTTFEALWMGVPTLTMTGDRHSARVGASILSRIGLSDFIATDEASYIAKAVSLSQKTDYIDELRTSLRTRVANSDLCNAQQFAQDIEGVFTALVDKHAST